MGHGGRSRHAARDAETIGGGWWLEGGGEVQVKNVTLWERMWVVCDIKRVLRQHHIILVRGR